MTVAFEIQTCLPPAAGETDWTIVPGVECWESQGEAGQHLMNQGHRQIPAPWDCRDENFIAFYQSSQSNAVFAVVWVGLDEPEAPRVRDVAYVRTPNGWLVRVRLPDGECRYAGVGQSWSFGQIQIMAKRRYLHPRRGVVLGQVFAPADPGDWRSLDFGAASAPDLIYYPETKLFDGPDIIN